MAASISGTLPQRVARLTGGRTVDATSFERTDYLHALNDTVLNSLAAIDVNLVILPLGGALPESLDGAFDTELKDFALRARSRGMLIGVRLELNQVDLKAWQAVDQPMDDFLLAALNGSPMATSWPRSFYRESQSPAARRHIRNVLERAVRLLDPDLVVVSDASIVVGAGSREKIAFEAWRAANGVAADRATADGAENMPAVSTQSIRPENESAAAGDGVQLPEAGAVGVSQRIDWIRYRADATARCLEFIAGTLHELAGHDVALCADMSVGANTPRMDAGPCGDVASLPGSVRFIWDDVSARVPSRGRLLHHIMDIKQTAAAGRRVISPVVQAVDAALMLAMGDGSVGNVTYFTSGRVSGDIGGTHGIDADIAAMVAQARRRPELFLDSKPVADAVLYRPSLIQLVDAAADEVAYVQTGSALVTHRVATEVCVDPALTKLRQEQTLVLAGVRRIDEAFANRVAAHLNGGGSVLLVGQVGSESLDGQSRQRDLLNELIQRGAVAETLAGQWRGHMLGKGRLAQIDRPGDGGRLWLSSGAVRARGPDSLDQALAWLRQGNTTQQVPLSGTRVFELRDSADGSKRLLHVIELGKLTTGAPVAVRIALNAALPASKVTAIGRVNMVSGETIEVEFTQANGYACFSVESGRLYDLYVIVCSTDR